MLEGLNPSQLEAVTTTEGFVRVIAGAGSGKTRALSRRFAYLVNELGILPGNILCVTFTNKAANEMRQRIHNLTGDNDTGYINTFHGFCVSVLQEDSFAVQYPKSFLVLDNSDIDSMLRIIYEERGLTLRDMTFSNARDMIEMQKLFKHPDYYLDIINMDLDALRAKYLDARETNDIIFYGYMYQQKKCFGLDYNDLIKFTLYIFEQNEDIRLKWQKRLEYIMIDEFQDIDDLQYELMEALCGYHKNLFIVGDPDQTIYTWRGANVKFLLDFDRHYPTTKTIMMMRNYRSTPQILAAVNSLIEKNRHRIKKDLIPTLPSGESVLCHHARTAEAEAEWIADEISRLCEKGVDPKDIAILYRAHYVTRSLEEVFRRRKLPYAIYSGVQFYNRAEIKDALSYLRMISYKDDLAFRRVVNVPKRNIGISRMKALEEYSAAHGCSLYEALVRLVDDDVMKGTKAAQFIKLIERYSSDQNERPISELMASILDESRYEETLRTEGSQERLDNLAELKQSIYEYETSCGEEATLEHYLAHIALFTNNDTADAPAKVKMMTVHAAKGLEFPYVFLCGMNEGVFPSRKVATMPGMEEERRLAFVAMTRAEKRLFLSEAEGFNIDGSPRYPSRFILDISDELIEYTEPRREGLIKDAREYIRVSERFLPEDGTRPQFEAGQRVDHPILGPGTIIDVDVKNGANIVKFDSMDTPRAISFKAKLMVRSGEKDR
ncbi:MAG: UvrD-helicase domain-containing protein [Clostridia bacterium]|nr:UvrD-helicase domain-containing protein [Clostridia bacterium]